MKILKQKILSKNKIHLADNICRSIDCFLFNSDFFLFVVEAESVDENLSKPANPNNSPNNVKVCTYLQNVESFRNLES